MISIYRGQINLKDMKDYYHQITMKGMMHFIKLRKYMTI